MSRDVEAPPTTPPAAGLGGIPKRRQLCLLFGLISISWGGFLVYLMYHGVHVTDRQSYMDNLDFKGADIDSIFGVETANACYKSCEEHESCLAYTYVKSEHVCWLKGEGYTTKSNPNTVSGAINATLADIRRSSAGNHINGSFGAFDSDSYPEEGEGGRELDREFDSTRADEWDNDDDGNYRADEEGVEGVDRVRASKQDIERYEDNTDFFGDIRLFTEVRTVAECADYCASERACAAWTLDKPRLLCMLRLLGGSTVRYTADAISARLSAAELTERAAERELDLAPERASPAELAGNASADAAPSASTIASARPAYSGPPWPLPADLAARGVTDNVDLLGGDLHRVRRHHVAGVETLADCRAACVAARAEGCAAFTLTKATGFCWLKNTSHTAAAQNRTKGLVSGLMSAAR